MAQAPSHKTQVSKPISKPTQASTTPPSPTPKKPENSGTPSTSNTNASTISPSEEKPTQKRPDSATTDRWAEDLLAAMKQFSKAAVVVITPSTPSQPKQAYSVGQSLIQKVITELQEYTAAEHKAEQKGEKLPQLPSEE